MLQLHLLQKITPCPPSAFHAAASIVMWNCDVCEVNSKSWRGSLALSTHSTENKEIWLAHFKQEEGSSSHLPSYIEKDLPVSDVFLWALSQMDMQNKSGAEPTETFHLACQFKLFGHVFISTNMNHNWPLFPPSLFVLLVSAVISHFKILPPPTNLDGRAAADACRNNKTTLCHHTTLCS